MFAKNKPFYVIKQQSDSSIEYHMTVVARYASEDDAEKLISALKTAHELELEAGDKYKTKYNFFSLSRSHFRSK